MILLSKSWLAEGNVFNVIRAEHGQLHSEAVIIATVAKKGRYYVITDVEGEQRGKVTSQKVLAQEIKTIFGEEEPAAEEKQNAVAFEKCQGCKKYEAEYVAFKNADYKGQNITAEVHGCGGPCSKHHGFPLFEAKEEPAAEEKQNAIAFDKCQGCTKCDAEYVSAENKKYEGLGRVMKVHGCNDIYCTSGKGFSAFEAKEEPAAETKLPVCETCSECQHMSEDAVDRQIKIPSGRRVYGCDRGDCAVGSDFHMFVQKEENEWVELEDNIRYRRDKLNKKDCFRFYQGEKYVGSLYKRDSGEYEYRPHDKCSQIAFEAQKSWRVAVALTIDYIVEHDYRNQIDALNEKINPRLRRQSELKKELEMLTIEIESLEAVRNQLIASRGEE